MDNNEPTYVSLSRDQWQHASVFGDVTGEIEFTNSMRLATKASAEKAGEHPTKTALLCKLDTERLFRDHGQPTMVEHPDHHDHEFSFSFFKHRIEQFVHYVIHVIEVTADELAADGDESGSYA